MFEIRIRPLLVALSIALALCVSAAAASASPAQAMTIDYGGGVLKVTGTEADDGPLFSYGDKAPGVDPTQLIEIAPFADATLTSAATAAGCAPHEWEGEVWVCPRPSKIVVNLLGGDDSTAAFEDTDMPFTVPFEIDGGPGDDRLDGGSGNDRIQGGEGNDALTGRDGDDSLYGQAGNDVLNGDFSEHGPGGDDHLDGGSGDDEFEGYVGYGYPASLAGSDTYIGGPGTDSFSYFHRNERVRISLDGVANDGMAGESDNVGADIEVVGGGSGDDVIVGSAGPDQLWGSDGDDRIHGGGGDDKLWGDEGDDLVEGGPGNDVLDGGCMTDTLVGGPGRDSFNSDGNCSSSSLRSPLDRIEARDGEADELIFCQRSTDQPGDVAVVDPSDPVTNSGPGACKEILVGPSPRPPAGGGAPKGKVQVKLGPSARLLTGNGKKGSAVKQRIVLKKKRALLGTLYATKRTVVKVRASVRKGRKSISLGSSKVTLKPGKAKALALKLPRRALRAVKGKKKVAVATSFAIGKKTYRKRFQVRVVKR